MRVPFSAVFERLPDGTVYAKTTVSISGTTFPAGTCFAKKSGHDRLPVAQASAFDLCISKGVEATAILGFYADTEASLVALHSQAANSRGATSIQASC